MRMAPFLLPRMASGHACCYLGPATARFYTLSVLHIPISFVSMECSNFAIDFHRIDASVHKQHEMISHDAFTCFRKEVAAMGVWTR